MHGIRGLLARTRRITRRRVGGAGIGHRTSRCWKGLNLWGMHGVKLDGTYDPLEREVFRRRGAGDDSGGLSLVAALSPGRRRAGRIWNLGGGLLLVGWLASLLLAFGELKVH